jgi:hypothetical protein
MSGNKSLNITLRVNKGHAIAHAVYCQLLAAETQVCTQAKPFGIYGGHSGTGTGFSLSSSFFLCKYHSVADSYSFIYQLGDGQWAC